MAIALRIANETKEVSATDIDTALLHMLNQIRLIDQKTTLCCTNEINEWYDIQLENIQDVKAKLNQLTK
ncbi:hypothetical protein ACLIBH_02215 [Virgibacillus sp. W0430]|uniref:hypothetical protein n=1 Tax=Virgibacillus sp. W0430 TaxID=3391580 RepID=UPI003F473979